ncbi:hypothetical protein KZ483_10735 [Paenibacillus sp. sptzw28]|uniref:WD40/YVTN/BNR-like repeat-containing protein n=1 Tax=Paenibacillus sp. sptzw28 TaxID=715179 RepID=UPI001C6F13BD|nr:hypothetical protein [Paenibacillus sp. sptzw28]QYR23341.1 hypothetical protein KZ483_10735 [Paenibacillus sp. sptzw28]
MNNRRFSLVLVFVLLLSGIIPSYASADVLDEWHPRNPLPAGYDLSAVTYGNGTFVAVGSRGTILTSGDGSNWVSRPSGIPYDLVDVAFGNGRFVAMNKDGVFLTSSDGTSWKISYLVGSSLDPVDYRPFIRFIQSSITYGNGNFLVSGKKVFRAYPADTTIVLLSTTTLNGDTITDSRSVNIPLTGTAIFLTLHMAAANS